MKLDDLKTNDKNPRTIKERKFQALIDSLLSFPKMLELRPIVVEEKKGKEIISLGGNQRLTALKAICKMTRKDLFVRIKSLNISEARKKESRQVFAELQKSGGELPDGWIKRADDYTEEERREFIVKDNISYGEWEWGLLDDEWGLDTVKEWGQDIPGNFGDDDGYTTKVESPIYEPKAVKPKLQDLTDLKVYHDLIEEIEKSDIGEEQKEFLKLAAARHIRFSYSKIADYYAHSSGKVRKLMEKSALVIIDYEQAIELGFVKLYNDLENLLEDGE